MRERRVTIRPGEWASLTDASVSARRPEDVPIQLDGPRIEDLGEWPARRISGSGHRGSLVVIGVLTGLVGLGFAGTVGTDGTAANGTDGTGAGRANGTASDGRNGTEAGATPRAADGSDATEGARTDRSSATATPSPFGDADAAVEIVSPTEMARIGPRLDVRLRVPPDTARIHAAVVLGDIVLGWTTIAAPDAGDVDVPLTVFAPRATVEVRLRVSAQSKAGATVTAERTLALANDAPVVLTRARISDGARTAVIDGYGEAGARAWPVLVVDPAGRRVAGATVDLCGNGSTVSEMPGAPGGRTLGVIAFVVRLPLPPGVDPASLRAVVSFGPPSGAMESIAFEPVTMAASVPSAAGVVRGP